MNIIFILKLILMDDEKDIINNHKKLMNNYYYFDNNNNNSDKDNNKDFIHKQNDSKLYFISNEDINSDEYIKYKYDQNNFIYIKKNVTTLFGGFINDFELMLIENSYYYKNKQTNELINENPFYIFTVLLENSINPMLIPKEISSRDTNHIKVIFNNSLVFLINKSNKEIKDITNEDFDESDKNNNKDDNNNEDINEEKNQIYNLSNEIKNEINKNNVISENKNKINVINNDNNDIEEINKKLFKELLKEKNISVDSTFEKEVDKLKYDQRFNLIPSMIIKQKIFNSYINELKTNNQSQLSENKLQKKYLNKYKLFLKSEIENGNIDYDSVYTDFCDKNYNNEILKNVPETQRELIFIDTVSKLKEIYNNNLIQKKQKYLSFIEKEYPPKLININTTIDQIKNKIKSKPEYISISSKTERNEIITEYLNKIKKLLQPGFRKYDTVKELEDNNYLIQFKKLLNEKIKKRYSYEEAINILKKYDENTLNNLSENKKKEIFSKFNSELFLRERDEFVQLLNEKIKLNTDISWGDAQRLLQYDERYKNILESEREGLFREYRDNIYNRILSQFESLVNERSDIITKDTPLEGNGYNKILMALKNDVRYQNINKFPDKRDKIIRMKVKELRYNYFKDKKNNSLLNKKSNRDKDDKMLYQKWEKGNVIK